MRQNRSARASTCRSAGSGGPPRRPFIKGSSDEISWIDEAQESHDSRWNSIPEASSSGRSARRNRSSCERSGHRAAATMIVLSRQIPPGSLRSNLIDPTGLGNHPRPAGRG